ncbi:MAG: hypothetical protein R3266_13590, partial [Gemmatimonadota bacterium]|nr:hypothetical protein [Gemmatimonadota bacterium]
RDEVWVADFVAAAVFSLNPSEDEYVVLGAADREPVQIEQPLRLAVSPDIGLAAYDGITESVDLFTFNGEFLRGFTPGFSPAVMAFSRFPLGYTFGIAAGDSGQDRRPVVIHTDLQGIERDTLLSAFHGPEALRPSIAERGETAMSPSNRGMWVWSKQAPERVYDLSPRGTRTIVLRPEDREEIGLLADRERGILWVVRPGAEEVTYAAYDTRLARELDEAVEGEVSDAEDSIVADSAVTFLGLRTTPRGFRPMEIHDGIVMGVRVVRGGVGMIAYDLHAERFDRPVPEGD